VAAVNVLYAAFVSVVVTLTVEWFLKPWLEVRKEQVMERQRNLRKLRELAESGTQLAVSLSNMDYHHSHPNRANMALREFRQELTTLKYGMSKKARKDAEDLASVSNSFPKDGTRDEWTDTYDRFLLSYAIFRYGRNESKAYNKLIEAGMVKDADE
jgi:hypothetical protein